MFRKSISPKDDLGLTEELSVDDILEEGRGDSLGLPLVSTEGSNTIEPWQELSHRYSTPLDHPLTDYDADGWGVYDT